MKKVFALVCLVLIAFSLVVIGFAHPGGTDGNGGHYNRNTGEYHYHHGYSEHQHPNGECPYEEPTLKWSCDKEGCTVEGEHYHLKDFETPEATTEALITEQTDKNEGEKSTLRQVIDGVIEFAKELGTYFAILLIICGLINAVGYLKDRFLTRKEKKRSRN